MASALLLSITVESTDKQSDVTTDEDVTLSTNVVATTIKEGDSDTKFSD